MHSVDSAVYLDRPPPGRLRMLGRGLLKRCPLCGSGKLFTRWFRMKERCPRCGYLFEREEGFFLGAYVINLGITEGLLLVLGIVPLIVYLASDPDAGVMPFLLAGLALSVLAPVAFYPFSRTLWAAIDLIIRPAHTSEPKDNR